VPRDDDQRGVGLECVPLEELLVFFDRAWAGFWVWMDQIGRNAQPLPAKPPARARVGKTGLR
jgi:hypothetical protein